MASAVTAAERKVIDRKELVQKRTAEVDVAKKQLDVAKAGRERAAASLKTSRESLAALRKKQRATNSLSSAAVGKRKSDKRTTATKGASKRKSPTRITAPKKAAPTRSVCTLCHKEITDTISAKLNCGCHFHMACVARWRERGRTQCPTCLAPMENSA